MSAPHCSLGNGKVQLYATKSRLPLRDTRLLASFAAALVCVLPLASCIASGSDPNGGMIIIAHRSTAGADEVHDANGPTILLSYSEADRKTNPISSFMYFVPLVSPTLVDQETSQGNEQQICIVSYERKVASGSFRVACEYEISGKGFHRNAFDPAGMIAAHTGVLKKGESLTDMLDYLEFEGEGFGRIVVKGTMAGEVPTVTEVSLQFDVRGRRSPVTVGLYDVKPRDGKYQYENRSNEVVARVNSLIFKRTDDTPRMGIRVASIAAKNRRAGLLGGLKGALANFFIPPQEITQLGNQTVMDFGCALLEQKPSFTFPKAANVREEKRVAADASQDTAR